MKYLKVSALSLTVASLALAGCGKDDNGGGEVEMKTRLEVRMADAAGAYDQINLDLQGVEIDTSANAEGKWAKLTLLHPGTYDILDFESGIDTLLIAQDVDQGVISQIKLLLGEENSVVIGETPAALSVPADGIVLKLASAANLKEESTYKLWMEINPLTSIVPAEDGIGTYLLEPDVRSFTESMSADISGNVLPLDADPVVWAILGADTVSGAYPDAEGDFVLQGVPAGTGWTVSFDANVQGYEDQQVSDIEVVAGEPVTLDPVVLAGPEQE